MRIWLLSVLLPAAFLLAAAPSFAADPPAEAGTAKCYTVIFMDQVGQLIPTEKPVVGLPVGGDPIMMGVIPGHASRKIGEPAPCPRELVETITNLFNTSCTSEDRRAQAATNYKSTIENIVQNCANMASALAGKPYQPPAPKTDAPHVKVTPVPLKPDTKK